MWIQLILYHASWLIQIMIKYSLGGMLYLWWRPANLILSYLYEDDEKQTEVFTRLSRGGFDNYIGYLLGGVKGWVENGYETQSIENISPDKFINIMNEIKILDVRNEGEIKSSSLDSSIKIPLKTLENNLNKLNQNNKYYIHCAGG